MNNLKKFITNEKTILVLLFLIAAFTRFWQLQRPGEIVFDETYYARFAQNYLSGIAFFDVHPPLGKLLIGSGIEVFGYTSFGWRFIPALFGTILVPLSYLLAKEILKDKWLGIMVAFFITFDGLFITQSRLALLDIFPTLFTVLAFYLIIIFSQIKKPWVLLLAGLTIGLGLATKWTFAPFWVVIIIYFFLLVRNNWKKLLPGFGLLVVLPFIIYLSFFFFDNFQDKGGFWPYLKWWHSQAINFHLNLKDGHPYGSRPYGWLILLRPVWYYFKEAGNKTTGIIALGNPLIWWPALLAIFYGFWDFFKNNKKRLVLPLFVFVFFYGLWFLVKRVQFQYYILPVLPFYFMLLAYFWKKIYFLNRILALSWLILIIFSFIFFYPLLAALPISKEYYHLHIWFSTWI